MDARVAITGGARGIGLALAKHFAARGAVVTIIDIDGDEARRRAADLDRAIGIELDVSRTDATMRFFQETAEPFDVVIANAGVSLPRTPAVDLTEPQWDWLIDHNLKGVFNTISSAAVRMRSEKHGGRIIATASVASVVAEPGFAAYAAAKWGVLGLVKAMAMELVEDGILVNAVCPGDVRTRFLDETAPPSASSGPLGRPADVSEIVGIYDLLAGPAGSYLVGEAIVVDGGLSLTALA
ncbi:SDR family oxidoreductase [Microbacterium capsulatum]|uniref:SDR family oxidoreductase n=1 Tax=Microbacterium capsulatum TaxID=3041921 RepID=A0ABU0XDA4_9MICO|nr:SDR family oxidoreductase [Microbacterium sp. ASV81]MDQ4213092.1 SDR family oxidoreductase [Microbacterium sp. ASV81]